MRCQTVSVARTGRDYVETTHILSSELPNKGTKLRTQKLYHASDMKGNEIFLILKPNKPAEVGNSYNFATVAPG